MHRFLSLISIAAICLSFAFAQTEQNPTQVQKAFQARNQAIHLLPDVWMRDPYITQGPSGDFFLTYTTGKDDIPLWRSQDLINWTEMESPYSLADASNHEEYDSLLSEKIATQPAFSGPLKVWAPEMYFLDGKWISLHTSNVGIGNLLIGQGDDPLAIQSDWGSAFGRNHDPAIFTDRDGSHWLVSRCAAIQRIAKDWSGLEGEAISLNPSDRKLGHEGCFILQIDGKYVLFGTAWSTDEMRHGTYNLYYCVADSLTGPYGPRQFAGRFLGHSTFFQDKEGQWWATAFFNANKAPLSPDDARTQDLSETAYSINRQGLTLVPIDIRLHDGNIVVEVLDKAYAEPGAEEVQSFE
ncbi:MAG: family 43 glycosylhydrolase [Bacteroidia bacterium]|nr:family 43 glycosylhydrolase [Bacteroidia bacterium]